MTQAYVHSFETFGSVDGPGVRFVVFMQGCKMRCRYCHNPDSWKLGGGEVHTPEEILNRALRYRSYWGKSGGITVSGGEPLLQMDFMLEFFKLCKSEGVHTTIDTAAGPFTRDEPFFSQYHELLKYTDLLMIDVKHIRDDAHRELTHVPNDNILDCIRYTDSLGKKLWIRHVLVPGVTDQEEDLKALGDFIATLKNVRRAEILPYHSFGMFKWETLGFNYTLKDTPSPSEEEIKRAQELIGTERYQGYKEDEALS